MKKIIFNADVGEEAGFDHQIMPYVSWCNIACGAHAGSIKVIEETMDLAIKHNVKIGAHPSYPDRENFGREQMNITYDDLVKSLTEQIEQVKQVVEKKGGKLHHVKPHGALYNVAVKNEEVAMAILNSVKSIDKSLIIITPKESKISYLSGEDFRLSFEVFADRNYQDDLALVSRAEYDAVITDPELVFEHVFQMVKRGAVKTKFGKEIAVQFDTVCVHGDNPKSVQILKYLHQKFLELGYDLKV